MARDALGTGLLEVELVGEAVLALGCGPEFRYLGWVMAVQAGPLAGIEIIGSLGAGPGLGMTVQAVQLFLLHVELVWEAR